MLAVAELSRQESRLILVLTENSAAAQRWHAGLDFFGTDPENNFLFPDWETLPYDAFSPHQDITSERLATLRALQTTKRGVLSVPITTLLQRIAPTTYRAGASFDLMTAQEFDIQTQRMSLESAGYQLTDTVNERGQYAVRGSVMDIFPMGSELPVRIDLFDDEIETLRTFDPETQRTVERIEALKLLPAKEFPFDDAGQFPFAINITGRQVSTSGTTSVTAQDCASRLVGFRLTSKARIPIPIPPRTSLPV